MPSLWRCDHRASQTRKLLRTQRSGRGLPVFRIGGPGGPAHLDRLCGPVQSSLFRGPGRPVYGQWAAWTACAIAAKMQKANTAGNNIATPRRVTAQKYKLLPPWTIPGKMDKSDNSSLILSGSSQYPVELFLLLYLSADTRNSITYNVQTEGSVDNADNASAGLD